MLSEALCWVVYTVVESIRMVCSVSWTLRSCSSSTAPGRNVQLSPTPLCGFLVLPLCGGIYRKDSKLDMNLSNSIYFTDIRTFGFDVVQGTGWSQREWV